MGLSHYFSARAHTSKWRYLAKKLRNWLELNQHCLLCHQPSGYLICAYCDADINYFEQPKYQHNLLNNIAVSLGLSTVNFESLTAIAQYQWPLSNLITQLKFHQKSTNARGLAQLFCQHGMPPKHKLPDAIIPIPLHKSRLAQRKYNQAAIIALEIAKTAAIPCFTETLARPKKTLAQTELSASQRHKNTKDAFCLNTPLPLGVSHIALFDDVITTGATLSSAADTLRNHYPQMQIDAWSICITPKSNKPN